MSERKKDTPPRTREVAGFQWLQLMAFSTWLVEYLIACPLVVPSPIPADGLWLARRRPVLIGPLCLSTCAGACTCTYVCTRRRVFVYTTKARRRLTVWPPLAAYNLHTFGVWPPVSDPCQGMIFAGRQTNIRSLPKVHC